MGRTSIKNKLILCFLLLLLVVLVVAGVINHLTNDFIIAQGITVALAMGIGTIFGIIFSKSILKRLNNLSNVAREISNGDLTREVNITSLDEIRDLEEIFSLMVNQLRLLLYDMKNVSLKIHETNSILARLAKKLLQSSNEIDVTAKSIATSSAEQTQIVQKVTQKLERGIKVMDELVKQSSNTISKVDAAIQKTQRGETNARETLNHLELVLKQMSDYAQQVSRLPDKVEKIKVITNVMETIAQKTDLLSLNASIEATRAGESGKGFAIVADEIRNMAENSKQSSQTITKLVENILEDNRMLKEYLTKNQSDINEGRKIIKGIVQTFSETLFGVREIFEETKGMGEVTARQAEELRSFTENFKELSGFAHKNSESTQKTTIASKNQKAEVIRITNAITLLDKLSKKMIQTQQQFKLPEKSELSADKLTEENIQ
ncbi:MAG: methyl-accepting chemotaxis protein [Proteobacteria bacterium]|nr:methyl-accepting chemotaxis protein [Pseudomonadota bacterium]